MLKNKFFWIVLIIIILAAGGGFYYYTTVTAHEGEAAEEPEIQTAMTNRGDIVIYASGTGQIVPVSEIGLGFEESGQLIELNAVEGQQVVLDEVLARLETEKSVEEIAASVADSELAVIKAENALEDLYADASDAKTLALADIDTYTQAVRDANYSLYNYTMPSDISDLETEEAVQLTKEQLEQAIEAFEPYRYLSEYDDTREEYLEDVNEAQALYDAAVKRQNYEYALEVAQTNLAKAQSEYEKYSDGPAENDLAEAEAELENAKADLELALEEQAVIDLVSPMDGTILEVNAVVGQTVGTEDIITLADLSQPTLEVYVDETDLDKVAVGKSAEIIFDALPDRTFYGEVVLVSPELVSVSNVMAVRALVVIDNESLDSEITLPSGLNAAVDIISGKAEDAILVPVEAVRDLGGGDYAVFVVGEDGEPKLRPVEVGLMDVTSVEIISGLEPGETVTTGIVATD
jgi:RND family efflux transporter MFP subunit